MIKINDYSVGPYASLLAADGTYHRVFIHRGKVIARQTHLPYVNSNGWLVKELPGALPQLRSLSNWESLLFRWFGIIPEKF